MNKKRLILIILCILCTINCNKKSSVVEFYTKTEIDEKLNAFEINKDMNLKTNVEDELAVLEYYTKSEVDVLLKEYVNKDYAVFEETKKPDAAVGSSNGFVKRNLNNESSKYGNSISLNKNTGLITLTPGIYKIRASAPAFYVISHQLRLRNVTKNTTALLGTSESSSVSGIQTRSFIEGVVKVDNISRFELQHYLNNSQTKSGFGISSNSGEPEVFARIIIEKIGAR